MTTWMPVEPVPTTPTRFPSRSTGSSGHRRRQVPLALEALEAGEIGVPGRRQVPDREDEESSVVLAPVGRDQPPVGLLVVARGRHRRLELDVAAQVEPVGHELEVAQDLGLRRVALGPLPLVEELIGERELVVDALDVAAGARVAVPVPGPADAAAALDEADREAELAQAMERVEPAEAGADDERVKGVLLGTARHGE